MNLEAKPTIELLSKKHDRNTFECGVDALDRYIRKHASQDSRRRVARLFVATLDDSRLVAGYYTLSAAGVEHGDLPENVRRGLPRYPVPMARIGRLAVDKKFQGKGLGSYLLVDALQRVMMASQVVAIYAVIVDATDESAKRFYLKYGFTAFPEKPLRLFIPMETVAKLGH